VKNTGRLEDSGWTIEGSKVLTEMREARSAGAELVELVEFNVPLDT